jgi:protein associated with RNAse G/E
MHREQDTLRVGQRVEVKALRADGQAYRWWTATVESVHPDRFVTWNWAGHHVESPQRRWLSEGSIRAVYWLNRLYNLIEVYTRTGDLEEIYINVASPPRVQGPVVSFVDHELDVTMRPGEPPRVVDEDEFEEAAVRFAYAPEFQAACRRAAAEALVVAAGWHPAGLPWPGTGHARS